MRRVASAQVRAARQQYRFRHTGKTVDQRDSDGKLIAPSLKKKPMTDRKDSAGSKKNCTTRSSSKPRSAAAAGASISKPPKSQPEPEPMSKTEMDSLAVEETLPDDRADAGDADDAGAKKPAKSHIKVERQKTDPAIKKKISFRESHERSASLRVRPVKKATSSSPSPSPSSLGSESSLGDEEEAAAALMNSEDAGAGAAESSTGDDGFPAKKRTALAKRRNSLFVKRGSISMEPIKTIVLDDVYSVYKQLGTGRFGYIKLAEHKQSKSKIAIKFFERPKMKQVDFIREYNYSFFLSPHPNIIDTYEGMFQAKDESAFLFVQEFCPCASLREAVEGSNGQGIGEHATKEIMIKVLAAIEFMHNENLVHRNLKAENILIFDNKEFSRVKVTDFGLTRKVDTSVKYLEYVNSYHAPELCETVVNEVWTVNKSIDIWAIGVLFYYSLKGRFPWQKATIMCKPYWEWDQWLKRKNPQLPKRWDPFTEKALKLFKRTLNPKHKDRWSVKDVRKCVAKERLLKPSKSMTDDDLYYAPVQNVQIPSARSLNLLDDTKSKQPPKRKSLLHQWVAATFNTMAEISEQVVSARDD